MKLIICLLLLLSPAVFAQSPKPPAKEGTLLYQVKPKDHLAEVLRSMGFQKSLWGANGLVARTVKANPGKPASSLEPGSWIYIPVTSLPEGSAFEIANGEIVKGAGAKPKAAARPVSETIVAAEAEKPIVQLVNVVCPDQSSRAARVQIIEKTRTKPATLIVLEKEGLCVPHDADTPAVAAPLPTEKPITRVGQATPTPIPGPGSSALVEVDPTAPDEKAPAKDSAASTKAAEPHKSRDISQLPFFVSFIGGYMSNTIEYGGAMGTANLTGPSYGARTGYVFRRGDWGYLVDASYRQAQVSTNERGANFLVMNALEYGLGLSHRHWTIRAGIAANTGEDNSGVGRVSVNDNGWYGSLAYSFFLNARLSWSIEGRYTGVTYRRSSNASLPSDASSTQLETLATFDYRFSIF